MRRLAATIALAWATLACASGPTGPVGTASLPALAAGDGRLVLYHTNDTDMTMFHPKLTVAGETVGELPIGSFLYVDRAPGVYPVGVLPQPSVSAFGDQAPTQPVAMIVSAGATSYLRFGVVTTPVWVKATLTPMDPADALRDLASLRLVTAPASGD